MATVSVLDRSASVLDWGRDMPVRWVYVDVGDARGCTVCGWPARVRVEGIDGSAVYLCVDCALVMASQRPRSVSNRPAVESCPLLAVTPPAVVEKSVSEQPMPRRTPRPRRPVHDLDPSYQPTEDGLWCQVHVDAAVRRLVDCRDWPSSLVQVDAAIAERQALERAISLEW